MRTLTLLLALGACGVDPVHENGATQPGEPTPHPVDPGATAHPTESPLAEPLMLRAVPSAMVDLVGEIHGPSAIVRHGETSLVADADRSTLLRSAGPPLLIGEEPHRLLAVGSHLFVTLRGAGEVVRLDRVEDEWVEGARAQVGAEPWSLVLDEARSTLWVSLSMEDAVVALDPATLQERARVAVPDEPRGVLAHPEGGILVTSARAPSWHRVEVDGTVESHELPERRRFESEGCPTHNLVPRITGDPVLDEAGERIIIPTLYADTLVTPLELPQRPDGRPIAAEDADCREVPPVPEADQMYGVPADVERPARVDRINSALVIASLGEDSARVVHLGTNARVACGDNVLRSQPSALALVDAEHVAVAHEGTGHVQVVGLAPTERFEGGFEVGGGLATCATVGTHALTLEGSTLYGWSFVSRELMAWTYDADTHAPSAKTELGQYPSPLPADVQRGRRLFFEAGSSAMSARNSGVSCSTCHLDARSDSRTWMLPEGPRQTPSLAGMVSLTAPITWSGEVQTVAQEALRTSTDRMGGHDRLPAEYAAIEAFVDATRDVVAPALDPERVEEGRVLFHDATVGCATCHVGDRGTDNTNHAVLGFEESTNTPTLTGVFATAPYLHDGSAPTLRAVLERARDGSMGDTSGLDEDQMASLELYTRSL